MGAGTYKQGGYVAEINVTPFVDVMLVLLIIFMVTAPMMSEGLEVDLPQTRHVEVLPTENENMVMTVKKDGSIYLDEYRVPREELQDKLRLLVKDKKKSLFLQADKEVAYGVVVDAMAAIKEAGIEKMGVVAQRGDAVPPSKDKGPQKK
ncbi:MAG: protein TolR [Deltaproteobacteria bacterium]|jgi:biopolymer transport protein TolR|nr:protein TolR [Deltaproteobacteria bacterium]